jgi:hypothetical protein
MTSDEPAGSESPPRETGEQEERLRTMRPMAHDEDERPSREDRNYGSTIFTRSPVPLPRFLRGRKKQSP